MSAPPDELAFDLDNAIAAADRWERRRDKREENKKNAQDKKWTQVEDRGRLAKVVNRRITQLKLAAKGELPDQVMDLVKRGEVREDAIDDELMERVIGATRDFLGISFFARGIDASRAVCRIVSLLSNGRRAFGTGFMVTPHLLITNHHVLDSAKTARASTAEFNYQLDARNENEPVYRFALDPGRFFVNDKPHDFALVAVADKPGTDTPLSSFGYCPLIGAEGKIANTEWVNIVQHPKGDLKQVVVRENRLIDMPDKQAAGEFDRFAYYEADTEPGSSGSPVFNDLWEVIALHHSSVPRRNENGDIVDEQGRVWRKGDDPTRIAWVGNEGIRISRIVNHMATVEVSAAEKPFYDEFMLIARSDAVTPILPAPPMKPPRTRRPTSASDEGTVMPDTKPTTHVPISISVPINITLSLGADGIRQASVSAGEAQAAQAPAVAAVAAQRLTAQPQAADEEKFTRGDKKKADPDAMKVEKPYDNRKGFDPNFLGFPAPLPKLASRIRNLAVKVGNGTELKYHHYSVIMNGERKTAFVSAVNIDLQAPFNVSGERKDKWFFDDRIDEKFQAGNDAYANEVTDRGHLTRRADAAWGNTQHEANKANADTFHWTNCSIQHQMFNRANLSEAQDRFLWGSIEDHIADEAKAMKKKLSVFNGPIMKDTDKLHRGILVPQAFFKVVVCMGDDGKPQAFGFRLSQKDLVKNLPEEGFEERDFEPGEAFEASQVLLSDLEKDTGLLFGDLKQFDVLAEKAEEVFTEGEDAVQPLASLSDIIMRRD